MKIVATNNQHPILQGLIISLAAIQEDIITWAPQQKPVFDMMEELQPDCIILHQDDFNPSIVEALQYYKPLTIILGVFVPPGLSNYVLCVPSNIPETIQKNIPNRFVMQPAANSIQFRGAHYMDNMASDILFVHNTPISRPCIDLLNVLDGQLMNKQWVIKVIGNQPLPSIFNLGLTNPNDNVYFICSSKICLDINEYILYEAILHKCFVLSTLQQELVPTVKLDNLEEQIHHYLNEPKLCHSIVKQAHKEVKNRHTYLHRLKDLGQHLEISHWAPKIEKILTKI
jgi:hypothetical protein